MLYVQSFITNISFPTNIEELYNYCFQFNMEQILCNMPDAEEPLCYNCGWTCPRWAKTGDIVFFYHAKTAINRIKKLSKELYSAKDQIDDDNDYWFMQNGLKRAKAIWNEYGGKIFAVGRVSICI